MPTFQQDALDEDPRTVTVLASPDVMVKLINVVILKSCYAMVTFPSALSCLESIQISSSKLKFKSEISFGLSIDCSPPIVSTGNKLGLCCPPISGNGPFSFCHKSRANSFFTSNASTRKMSLGTCLKYFSSII